jgi:hypothetical protein
LTEKNIYYFDKCSRGDPQITAKTLELARKRAGELHIKDIIVNSSFGYTIFEALKYYKDFNLVMVGSSYGQGVEPGKHKISEVDQRKLREAGVKLVIGSHPLSGISRSIGRMWAGIGPEMLVANTLRLFSEGVKVCVESTIIAADAGAIQVDREIIAIAGTSRGADTALVIKPTHLENFFNEPLKILEIICKPRERDLPLWGTKSPALVFPKGRW